MLFSFGQDSIKYYNTQIISNFKQDKLAQSDVLFTKKIEYLKRKDNLEEFYYAYLDYFWLNKNSKRFYLFKDAEKKQWRLPITDAEKIAKLHLIINKAYNLKQSGKISESVLVYEKALAYHQKNQLKTYNIVEYCLKPLANNYTRLGDYKRADALLKYTIEVVKSKNNISQLISTYLNLSITYQSLDQSKKALDLLKKALDLKPKNISQKSTIYSQIAKNLLKLKQYDKAIKTANKAINLSSKKELICTNLTTIASCYYFKNNFKKSVSFFKKALKKTNNKRIQAKIHNQLAEVFIATKKYNKALENYQKGLQILLTNFKPNKLYQNPKKTDLYPENTLVEVLDGKAKIYEIQKKYQQAISCYKLSIYADALLREVFSTQDAKLLQVASSKKRIEKIITIYNLLLNKSNDTLEKQKIIKNMIAVVEKSKATVLSDILYKKQKYTNIKNDSLLIQKNELEKIQATYENEIALEQLKNTTASIEKIKKLLSKKVAITTKIQLLKQQIQKKYHLSFTKSYFNIETFQKNNILNNQLFIVYFDTKKHLYIFKITKEKTSLRTIDKKNTNYQKDLQVFIDLFAQGSPSELNTKISDYRKYANTLFTYLLKPELENTNKKIVTIISDGKLNFLPFDALLTNKTTTNNFEKMPFLIKQFNLNYGYSLRILAQQFSQKNSVNSESFLGFFPIFENNHRKLQELSYTINERESIKKYVSGIFLSNERATKEAFLKQAKKSNLIHISTHASAGGFYEPATIAFYNKTLYLPEIYGLQLQTDLLVLSACETGIGKLNKGEGAMSLARGFAYTGVKNLIVSQWKVNDKATSILMASFYKNYKKTNSKNQALHQAKLDYLNDNTIPSLKKSPYYWSGFMFIGNATIPQTTSITYYYLGFFIFVVILLFVFYFYRKMKKLDIKVEDNTNLIL